MPAEAAEAAAAAAFTERFGRSPAGVWAAPGRVNLIGEHTDYNDGYVLPLALDRQATVAAAPREDDLLSVVSVSAGVGSIAVPDIAPGEVTGWLAYVAGPVWALDEAAGRGGRGGGGGVRGLDVLLDSDVPVGAGLSSSAAVACAVLLAARDLHCPDLYDGPDEGVELARLAQRAENEVVGVPCGMLDQMASLLCRRDTALFLDTRTLAREHLPLALSAAGLQLLILDTRAPHSLAEGAYAQRRRSCEEAAALLGVPALRDATLAEVEKAADRLGPERLARARHVVTENERVLAAADLLREGSADALGPLLSASHRSLRDDFAVSCAELDVAVDAALEAGAVGARMTGAGFGGSAIALVPEPAAPAVAHAVSEAFAVEGFAPPSIFPAVPSDGARRVA